MLKLSFILIILALSAVVVFAAHGHWIDHYTSASGMLCCGKQDCLQHLSVRIVEFQEYATIVEVAEQRLSLPPKSVHQSEDGNTHVCIVGWDGHSVLTERVIRCVFYTIGS